MTNRQGKTALFIDGANLHATGKALGFDVDYKRLLTAFERFGVILRAFYYTAVDDDPEFCSIRPLLDWLEYNGFAVVTKPIKEFTYASGERKIKRNVDVEIAVGAMAIAKHVDQIVLFSGDGDFRVLVQSLQRLGVRVTVVSTVKGNVPMIAPELRRQADEFIDLKSLEEKIARRAA